MTKLLRLRTSGYAAHPQEWISGTVFTEHLFVEGPKLSHPDRIIQEPHLFGDLEI